MTLVDLRYWVTHLRSGHDAFIELLEQGLVALHPFVFGELACGTLQRRSAILTDLGSLPRIDAATDDEVLQLIEAERLWGSGIGWIDAHLLAAAVLQEVRLLTTDRALHRFAVRMKLAASSSAP